MKSSKQHKKDKKEKKDREDRKDSKESKDSEDKDRDTAGEPLSKKQAKLLKKLEKMSPEEQAAYKEAALLARKVMYKDRKVKALHCPELQHCPVQFVKLPHPLTLGQHDGQYCLSTSTSETESICLSSF